MYLSYLKKKMYVCMCVYLGERIIILSFQNKNKSQFGLRRGSGDV